ncbi:hypothetical protein CFAM422_010726 [Trichoderma lentiforme]|uniref:Uncharacterized protein n=1 Tax=Trichoderma lentiforme TaxID=1567552 RepID=A0A9P5CAK2_9HYPO|nr:hypothetical protein CFAM422_010726 [Trichoderma lentiforme]
MPITRECEYLPPRGLGSSTAGVAVAATVAVTASVAAAAAIARASLRPSAIVAEATTLLGVAEAAAAAATTEAATAKLAEIAVGIATATTARARATTTTAAAEGGLTSDSLKEGRDLLVGLLEKVNELADNTTVAAVEEGGSNTSVSSTAGTTNSVDVIIDISGKVVVDDVGDVGNIKTTSSNSSSHQDGAASVAEELESTLTLTLSPVSVNGGGREALVDEEVGQRVGHALGLDEDEGQTTSVGVEDIEENRALVNVLDEFDLLGDVLRGRTNTTNRQENVVLEEISGEHLDVAREGGREHESLSFSDVGHVLTLNNTADLGLETHVQHAIGLIEHKILNVAQGDAASLYEIHKSSGGGNKKVASALNLAKLRANIGSTIHHTRADPRSVGKLSGLLVDLRNQLSSGGKDERGGVGLALTTKLSSSVGGDSRRTVDEGLRKDGEKETTSLARTSLGTSHEITTTHDDGDGVFLNGSRDLVAGHLDVTAKVLVERGGSELVNRLGDVATRGFNRDIVVLFKVDTGVLLGRIVGGAKELTLDTGEGRRLGRGERRFDGYACEAGYRSVPGKPLDHLHRRG